MPNVIYDEYGHAMKLGRVTEFVPTPKNDQAVELRVDMEWAMAQSCPEHPLARNPRTGLGWTHVRAAWARPKPYQERPAVMFLCPRGHAWEIIIPEPGEGSW